MILLQANADLNIGILFGAAIIGLVIYYYLIQAAVSTGVREALEQNFRVQNNLLRKQLGIQLTNLHELDIAFQSGYITEIEYKAYKKTLKK